MSTFAANTPADSRPALSSAPPENPVAASIAERFADLFQGSDRAHGEFEITSTNDSGKRVGEAVTKSGPLTLENFEDHLAGRAGFGAIPIRAGDGCLFGAIDVDVYKVDHGALVKRVEEIEGGSRMIVCRSKSGGAHIYLFLPDPVPAAKVKLALGEAIRELRLSKKKYEIFPKQDHLEPGELGNWINLPYFGGERKAVRPDGSDIELAEFLDLAERAKQIPLPDSDDEDDEAPSGGLKDYQRAPVEGHRFNYLKSDLGRYLQAHPEADLDELLRYADFVRVKFDPPIAESEWKKWGVRKFCRKLMAKEAEKPEKKKPKDQLILEAEGDIRAGFILARDPARQLHCYDGAAGCYRFDDDERFANILREKFAANKRPFAISEADLSKLTLNLSLGGTPKFWEQPPLDKINLANGILHLDDLELKPHSPGFLHPNQFDVPWDPNAECPEFQKFLLAILHPDEVDLVYEIIGYALVPDVSLQTAFLFHGSGANGKSQLLAVVMGLLGQRNYSTVPLHRLESSNFAAYALLGKLANVESDMTTNRLPGSAFFKSIVGGDPVYVERKYHDGASVKLYTRLFFSCNRYPRSADNSPGFFRKWKVLPFTKKDFDKTDRASRVPPPILIPRLLAEAPGILNKAVRALRELRERGDFVETKATRAAKLEFQSLTDSLSVWLDEHTVSGPNVRVQQKQLRAAYTKFCEESDYPPMGEKEFSARVLEYRPDVKPAKRHGVHCFLGIGLRAEVSEVEAKRAEDALF